MVRFSQHCELTIALHILNSRVAKRLTNTTIEIGCSKPKCFWCYIFLSELDQYLVQTTGHKIITQAGSAKETDDWLLPDAPAEVQKGFLDLLGDRMNEALHTLERSKEDVDDDWVSSPLQF